MKKLFNDSESEFGWKSKGSILKELINTSFSVVEFDKADNLVSTDSFLGTNWELL